MSERTVRIIAEWGFLLVFLAALALGLPRHLRQYWASTGERRAEPQPRGLLVPLLLSLAFCGLVVGGFLVAFL